MNFVSKFVWNETTPSLLQICAFSAMSNERFSRLIPSEQILFALHQASPGTCLEYQNDVFKGNFVKFVDWHHL